MYSLDSDQNMKGNSCVAWILCISIKKQINFPWDIGHFECEKSNFYKDFKALMHGICLYIEF